MVSELRKRRNEIRKSNTRNELLLAASAVFVRQGYHGTVVSDIVTEAGVGQGTFYRHFQSKREVFEALFDRLFLQILDEVAKIAEDLPNNAVEYREVSVRVVTAAAVVLKANQDLVMLFFREGQAIDSEFSARFEMVHLQIAAQAQGYLEHAMEHGFARRCHTYVVAQMLVGAGVRLMNEYFAGRLDDVGIAGSVREAVDFAFFGFGPHSGDISG